MACGHIGRLFLDLPLASQASDLRPDRPGRRTEPRSGPAAQGSGSASEPSRAGMSPLRFKSMLVVVLALGAFAALVATAPAAMRSDKINKNLCETTGGGKFVPIPGFPGEKADRRLLTDIKYLRRKLRHLHHRRPLQGRRPRRQRRASDRPRPRHRPEHRQGRYLEGDLEACQAGRAAAERADRAVPLGRLQRRRRPRPRQPPPPLLEPLRHPSGASGEDRLHAALPGLRFDRRRRRKHRRRQGRRQGRGWQRRRRGGGIRAGGGKGAGGGGGGISPRRLMAQFEALAADPVIETGGVGLP